MKVWILFQRLKPTDPWEPILVDLSEAWIEEQRIAWQEAHPTAELESREYTPVTQEAP